jgi:hypothetical protein
MMAYTKQQKELGTLVGLLLVAGLTWFFFVGKGAGSPTGQTGSDKYQPIDAQDYSVVLDRLRRAQSTEYKPSGRNIFVAVPVKVAEPPKPVEPPHFDSGPVLPPPPPPPQLSMKFFGYGTLPSGGGSRQAFLLDGDEVKIVSEGDTIQNHIRIIHIGNDRIEFEDTNTGLRNSAVLEMPPST